MDSIPTYLPTYLKFEYLDSEERSQENYRGGERLDEMFSGRVSGYVIVCMDDMDD